MSSRRKATKAAANLAVVEESPAPDALGVLEHVDPGQLELGPNVRVGDRLDDDFKDSIRERGVLEPIVAFRNDDGRLVVLRGQRRTVAAHEVGRSLVPVMVVAAPAEDDRVVDQLAENEHRDQLLEVERAGAYRQLAALGLTPTQIAKRTARPRADVEAGLVVAGSERACEAALTHEITLQEAAAIAEFEGNEVAVKNLVDAAARGGFEHTLQRLRDQRTRDEAMAAVAAQLAATGVKVVDPPNWNDVAKRLGQLVDAPTPEEHASCPGHAAYIDVDWADPADDADEDDEGHETYAPEYVCLDPEANGHTVAGHKPALAAGGKTEDELEADRAARREVLDNNKAWDSAETVRRDWLRTFAARKTPPAGAPAFIAVSFAWCDDALSRALMDGNRLGHELLGVERIPGYDKRGAAIATVLEQASANRAQVVALMLVVAAYEDGTSREDWRTVRPATTRYLRFLETQGYKLSDVELRACGAKPSKRKAGKA